MTALIHVVDVSAHTAPIHAGPRIEVDADSSTALNGIADRSLLKFPSRVLREADYRLPVVMSRAVYEDTVQWNRPPLREADGLYNEDTRIWDVLWMAKPAAADARNFPGVRFGFQMQRVPNWNCSGGVSRQTHYDRIALTVETMAYDRSGKTCLVITLLDESSY
jgi:hypothetical protein